MSEKILIGAKPLEDFVAEIFVAAGLALEWARAEAEILVWADLRGVGSHGVLRVPSYLAWMPRGLRRADAQMRVVHDRGAIGVLEADRGPGLYATRLAMDLAIEKARAHGLGWIWVRQGTHTGAMGYYAQRAADTGLIGIALCSSRPLMAYFGSRDAVLGTAPLAIAAPRKGASALVFDMASAATTIGAMAQARQSGAPLPPGVALDAQGRVTTDPAKAETPLPIAGPKGSGLGLMIECLASLPVGLPLLASALEEPALKSDYVQNAICAAIDPAIFGTSDAYAEQVDRLARAVAAQPKAEGTTEILMPGERGDRMAAHRLRTGIPLSAALWKQLLSEGDKRGIAPPRLIQT